jgi:hypothetical protein
MRAKPRKFASDAERKEAQQTRDRERSRKRHKEVPNIDRDYKLRKNFGISLADYNRMFEEQDGVCKICGNPETHIDPRTQKVFNLSVDHCHKTGLVRGLLCMRHNKALGLFNDDSDLLIAAVNYLQESRRESQATRTD